MKIKKIRSDAKWFCGIIGKMVLLSKKSSSQARSMNHKKNPRENKPSAIFPSFPFWVFSFPF
jgi:hypothetical protein